MSDQNQPKLSLEEELDVLEAVYKIGKEKGLELLRPDLMEKLEDSGRLRVKKKIYAFIDSQNLNLGVLHSGWKLDFNRFRKYLLAKYGVEKAFLFVGYVKDNRKMYQSLKRFGYELVFKPTVLSKSELKGNVDAELVLWAVDKQYVYDQAVIVTGDGDFGCLVKHLMEKKKLRRLLIPNRMRYSSLLREYVRKASFVSLLKNKLEYTNKKQAFARHE